MKVAAPRRHGTTAAPFIDQRRVASRRRRRRPVRVPASLKYLQTPWRRHGDGGHRWSTTVSPRSGRSSSIAGPDGRCRNTAVATATTRFFIRCFFFVFVSYRERVIFESHQALVNDSAKKFRRRVREGGGGRSVVGECVFLSSARQVGVALESSRGQEENRMRLSGPQAGDQLISYRAP